MIRAIGERSSRTTLASKRTPIPAASRKRMLIILPTSSRNPCRVVGDLTRQEGLVPQIHHDEEIRDIGDGKAVHAEIAGPQGVRQPARRDQVHAHHAGARDPEIEQAGDQRFCGPHCHHRRPGMACSTERADDRSQDGTERATEPSGQ